MIHKTKRQRKEEKNLAAHQGGSRLLANCPCVCASEIWYQAVMSSFLRKAKEARALISKIYLGGLSLLSFCRPSFF